jgi:2-keto-3-deoxy-L-rhamnonate aldolase RhmA
MLAHPLDHIKHANEETFLVLQIEDQDAVECVEEIAAVDGVDVLFVGPSDLSLSYGVPMQFDHPLVQNAMDRVAAACEKFGKAWGTITPTAEIAQNMVNRGARMITCGNDHNYLVRGFQASSEEFSRVQVLSKEAVL